MRPVEQILMYAIPSNIGVPGGERTEKEGRKRDNAEKKCFEVLRVDFMQA